MANDQSVIPQNCPDCDRKFTIREKTNVKFQKKAIILMVAASLTPAILMSLSYLINFKVPIKLAGLIFTAPLMGIAYYCYNLPKVLNLRCAKCKYTDSIILAKTANQNRDMFNS